MTLKEMQKIEKIGVKIYKKIGQKDFDLEFKKAVGLIIYKEYKEAITPEYANIFSYFATHYQSK